MCIRDRSSTYPIGEFSNAGLFTLTMLMFIGASPGSTGGGIKTSTFFALLVSVRSPVSYTHLELMWESATGNGKSYLRMKGKLPEHRLGKPVALRIESDSGNRIREMEILSVSGISAAGCHIDVVKDDTWPVSYTHLIGNRPLFIMLLLPL